MHLKKNTKIGIVGLGYVGLPLFLMFSKKFIVHGFEKDQNKINLLKKKISYLTDVKNSELNNINKKNLHIKNYSTLNECDYIIYTLPTPIKNFKPDLRNYNKSIKETFKYITKGQTLIFESTVYPGATENIFYSNLKNSYVIGKDIFLCYSPERVDPGKNKKKMKYDKIPKLISGKTLKCKKKILSLYSKFFNRTYMCSSIAEAECAKVFENTFRYINISFVNEFKMICDKLKIDAHQVIKASSTKPFGFKAFKPGPGIGGHCIPVDPFYLKWVAKKNGIETKLINISKKINNNLNSWIINKINLHIKNISNVLVVGLAYKKNINDLRESPSLEIYKYLLKKKNITTYYHDPFINEIKIKNKIFKSININKFKKIDVALILTNHDNINYKKIFKISKKILDSRDVYLRENKDKKIIVI